MVVADYQTEEIAQKAGKKNINKGIGKVMQADSVFYDLPDNLKTKLITVNSKMLIFFEKRIYDIT